jgi:hypothetical protein
MMNNKKDPKARGWSVSWKNYREYLLYAPPLHLQATNT